MGKKKEAKKAAPSTRCEKCGKSKANQETRCCWTVEEFHDCSEMFQEAVKFVKLAGSVGDAKAWIDMVANLKKELDAIEDDG